MCNLVVPLPYYALFIKREALSYEKKFINVPVPLCRFSFVDGFSVVCFLFPIVVVYAYDHKSFDTVAHPESTGLMLAHKIVWSFMAVNWWVLGSARRNGISRERFHQTGTCRKRRLRRRIYIWYFRGQTSAHSSQNKATTDPCLLQLLSLNLCSLQ